VNVNPSAAKDTLAKPETPFVVSESCLYKEKKPREVKLKTQPLFFLN
jgi:hypothetical protein